MSEPETWVECKKPCKDCPEWTERTAKFHCQHPWRLIIDKLVNKSDYLDADTLAACIDSGATVATGYLETGIRPSLQLYPERPDSKPHMNLIKIS